MDLSVIFDAIIPDNIRNLPLVKKCSEVFIEQLNRNSTISKRISKLYDVDSTTWVKRDSNGNITEVDDSEFVSNAKKILKMGLLYTYLNFIFTHVSKIQKNSSVISDIRENQYDSPLYNNVYDFLNSEYLGGLRYYQQCAGTEQAIKYMYAFTKYLETGVLTYDLVLEKMGVFNLAYSGSLNKDMFIGFNKNISHPCGWLCEYERFEPYEPIPEGTVLLDATFENEFIDLIGNYNTMYDSEYYDYEKDETVYYSSWLSEQKYIKYSDGIDGKCLEFTDVEYNDYTPDFTEYPPIDYSENDDFKQVAEIYSADLEGQYTGSYSTSGISGNEYYTRYINVSDTNYDDTLLSIPNNYNGISAGGYGYYLDEGGIEIEPYARIQYDDGRLTTVIDPEKFSLGRNAGYETNVDKLEFYFSLNEDDVVSDELKFTFSIRPKFIVKNPSEYITYMNDRGYSSPNYWTFFVYNNNAFTSYSNKYYSSGTPITEDDFFFTTVVANAYPSNYLYHTIDGYYLKARMYLTYNLRNSKKFGYYLVVNNESIKDAWNCRDALENTANGIDFKSNYTVIDLTEKGLNEEWIDIEVIVSSHNTTLNVDNNSYDFEVSNDNSDTVLVEVLPNIENFKGRNNNEHVLLFYEQIADFKLFLKPKLEINPPSVTVYDKGYIRNGYVVVSDVWNYDPLGYSILWSNGEITKDIVVEDVDESDPISYEAQATNRAGTEYDYTYVPSGACGGTIYKLGFESKENYDLDKWKLEFDFFNTIEDKRKRPMIVVGSYILEEKEDDWTARSGIECISIGANKTSRQFFEDFDYWSIGQIYELNSEEYSNHINKWCHCTLEVDNSTKTVSVKIDDIEVYNEVLQITFNPLKVFFYSYNNGYNGCSYGYKIDNLKITHIDK